MLYLNKLITKNLFLKTMYLQGYKMQFKGRLKKRLKKVNV